MLKVQKLLRSKSDPQSSKSLMKFFKTGAGQYGEGDKFLGCTSSGELRSIAKENQNLTYKDLEILLKSPFHEERALALEILVFKYKKFSMEEKQKLIKFYLKNRQGINNWDLVDLSSYKLLGSYCVETKDKSLIKELSDSPRHWDKRMAVVSTLALIREGDLSLTYSLALKFINEKEDLMHKACGWMMREAGKRDLPKLLNFIKSHGKKMPRTMLRYCIEKLEPDHRKNILIETRKKL